MQPIVRVFVSSTWLDLQPERLAVEKALQRMHQTKLNGMEYFGSRDETTRDVSLKEVDRSDVYVGIIGGRYGSGITKEEYQRASEKPLPRFIYFKDEQTIQAESRDPEQEKREKLADWKVELRKAHALGTGPFTSPDDLATRVTADLSNWLLDRYGTKLYLDGVPFDYAGRIENFLSEYLGTAKAPVPFGGREKDLKTLDTWLEDTTAPPYFMMAAPAGRGKSAMLVRWTRQLLTKPNLALVFVPISIRFRTNLSGVTFAALAARLARLHGDKIPDTPSTSVETWRGLISEYLRRPLPCGETLLVVLDGLDEAADWEAGPDLFPLTPADHVRVVVSARYRAGDIDVQDWLRRLGWERSELAKSFALDRLTREGMIHVLESMGCPLDQLGARVDIVSELYRLTDGDPLLVKLYVEDLWLHRERVVSLRPEDLEMLKPGLEGYFDRWWDDQRTLWGNESPLKERNVQTLLSVLACALGPLDQEALLRLTRLSSTWDLVETLKPLDRFIVGDGKANGYAFSHPRLNYYFKERLSSAEQQDWEQRFLEWGKDTVKELEQGTLAPAKAPAYIVQYYGAHLDQAHASAEVQLTLVCQGWSKAWEALEGSFAGFLNDVERAWKAAEFENEEATAKGTIAPRIGYEIRCALVRASINSLAANLPVELIVQLVKYQKWTFRQALSYARQIPSVHIRAMALARLATELKISKDLRDQTLVETLAAARELGTSGWEVLTVLAPHCPQVVLTAACEYKESALRAQVLAALAPYCPEVVLTAARNLKESALRAQVLAALAPYCPEAVLATARELEDHRLPPQVLATLAASQPEAVLAAAHKLLDGGLRVHVLKSLAPHSPKAVLAAAHKLEDSTLRAPLLTALVPYVAEHQRKHLLQQALIDTRKLEDLGERAKLLAALAPHDPEAVLTAAHELDDSTWRTQLLVALVPHVAEHQREYLLQQALINARKLGDHELHTYVLKALARYCPESVLTATRRLEDSTLRAPLLTALVPHVAEHQRKHLLQQALIDTRKLEDLGERAKLLAALAPHDPEAVLAAAHELDDSTWRTQLLVALVPHVAKHQREHLVEQVLMDTRKLEDPGERAKLLVALAPHCPEAVLAAAHQFGRGKLRAWFLGALALRHPKSMHLAVGELDDSTWRAHLLVATVPHVSEHQRAHLLDQALTAIGMLEDSVQELDNSTTHTGLMLKPGHYFYFWHSSHIRRWLCAKLMIDLLPYVPEQRRAHLLEQIWTAIRMLKSTGRHVQLLAALAPHYPEAVLAAAREPLSESERFQLLIALAPHCPQAVLAATRELGPGKLRARLLAALAPSQPETVLAVVRSFHVSWEREEVLKALAPHCPEAVLATAYELNSPEVMTAVIPYLRLLSNHDLYLLWRSQVRHFSTFTRPELMSNLLSLSSVIEKLGATQAFEDTLNGVEDVTTWWP